MIAVSPSEGEQIAASGHEARASLIEAASRRLAERYDVRDMGRRTSELYIELAPTRPRTPILPR